MSFTKEIRISVVLILLVAIFSCKKDITRTDKYLEVMKIHDVAMAEMGNIHNKSNEIKDLIMNAKSSKDSAMYVTTLSELEKAEDGMMEWMQEFKIPKDYESAQIFLENEIIKVKKVNLDIFSALDNAEKLLTSNN